VGERGGERGRYVWVGGMRKVAREKESERAREKESERQRGERESGKLKDRSMHVQIYSDITCFHDKCRDPPQGRDPERGMVRDRKWEKERERGS